MYSEAKELKAGVYVADGKAYGCLAPKFRGQSYAFMVTNIYGRGTNISMWFADLVFAGKDLERGFAPLFWCTSAKVLKVRWTTNTKFGAFQT